MCAAVLPCPHRRHKVGEVEHVKERICVSAEGDAADGAEDIEEDRVEVVAGVVWRVGGVVVVFWVGGVDAVEARAKGKKARFQ